MPSVYLVRHGDYNNPRNILPGRLPVELSKIGLDQSEKLRTFFLDKKIAKIYSSAVLRCKQTAEIIADGKILLVFDQRILETLSAYQGFWDENWDGDGYHFFKHRDELGGENLEDLQKRMGEFWDEVTQNLNENIIICSHGDPLQVLFSYIHKLPIVDDNAKEEDIPGWIEKGEYKEIKI